MAACTALAQLRRLAVAICSIGAAAAPAADSADASVFGGLGTWVDIYDGPVYAAPERTAQRMAARRREDGLGGDRELRRVRRRRRSRPARPTRRRAARARDPGRRLVPARAREAGARSATRARDAHVPHTDGRGVRRRRARHRVDDAPQRQRCARGGPSRSRGSFAAAAGDTPLAIIPFNPRGLERRPSHVAGLPVGGARGERRRVRADGLHGWRRSRASTRRTGT